MWSYTVENRADSHQGLYVQVTAKRNTSSGLNVRLWTSSGSLPINASDPSNPVILYAQVLNNRATVLNAKVIAILQRLGTNETGSSYNPIHVELRDNGNGGNKKKRLFCLIFLFLFILYISYLFTFLFIFM